MWSDQVKVSFTTAPRSLKLDTCSIWGRVRWVQRGGRSTLALGEQMSIHLVSSALSFSTLLVIQVLARSRQDWSEVLRSLQLLPTRKIVVSSAKRTVQSGGRTLGRPFMKSEKRVGPRTEPCGTLEIVELKEDVELDTRVTLEWRERQDWNQVTLEASKKFEKQEWMVHSVKGLRNIKEENSDILLLVKCLVPFVSAVQKKGYIELSDQSESQIGISRGDCWHLAAKWPTLSHASPVVYSKQEGWRSAGSWRDRPGCHPCGEAGLSCTSSNWRRWMRTWKTDDVR